VTSAVLSVRSDPTADAWLAAIRDRSRFGIAIAAMMRMIATTINSSINEKPRVLLFISPPYTVCSSTAVRTQDIEQFSCHLGLQKISPQQIRILFSSACNFAWSAAFVTRKKSALIALFCRNGMTNCVIASLGDLLRR
jgi:hypothetical protein